MPLVAMYDAIRQWAVMHVKTIRPCVFSIGISHCVNHRFFNPTYGYGSTRGYTQMHPLTLVSCSVACEFERVLIRYFKDRDLGSGRCENWRTGGDGVTSSNPAPHFVYIATKAVR
jgi:hypothetical protein